MKNNMKSVRLSDEVLSIVEGYRGNGFNEKFENICLDFMKGRAKMEKEQKLLQEHINDKRKEMTQVQERLRKVREIDQRTSVLVDNVLSLLNM